MKSLKRYTKIIKRGIVFLVCIAMIGTSFPDGSVMAAPEDDEEDSGTEIYSMSLDALCDSVEDAVSHGEAVDEGEFEFEGSSADKYEALFDTSDGLLYEIYPDLDEEGGSLTLRTFAKLEKSDIGAVSSEEDEEEPEDSDDAAEGNSDSGQDEVFSYYNVTGNEEIIFLLINNTDDEVSARIHVTTSDEVYETREISVSGNKDETNITLDTIESMDTMEYVVIDEKEENVETAALRVETDSDADQMVSGNSGKSGSLPVSITTVDEEPETASNAVKINTATYSDGCTALSGTLYDTVMIDGQSAAAFVTSLNKMGVDYGIKLLAENPAHVNTDAEFLAAIEDETIDEIILDNDFTTAPIAGGEDHYKIRRDITIDLNEHTITVDASEGTYYSSLFDIEGNSITATIKNGTIDGQKTAICYAIFAYIDSFQMEDVTVTGFNGNYSDTYLPDYFASVYFQGNTFNATNCSFSDNVGHKGLFCAYGKITLDGCEISGNTIERANTTYGVGMEIQSAEKVTIKNCTISNNKADEDHPNVMGGGITIYASNDITFYHNTITGNAAGTNVYNGGGGGIFLWACSGDITIKDNVIKGNSAAEYGGGIYIYNDVGCDGIGDVLIKDNEISFNTVLPTDRNDASGRNHSLGGGVMIEDFSETHTQEGNWLFINNDISHNTAVNEKDPIYGRGGGISLYGNDPNREFQIISGTFYGNEADWGGAIDFTSKQESVLRLYNTLITENTAVRGGGFWACPTSVTEMSVTFGGAIYGNTAEGTISSTGSDGSTRTYGATGDDIRYESQDSDIWNEIRSDNDDPADLENSNATVMTRALGGFSMDWYADDVDGARYDSEKSEPVDVAKDYTERTTTFGLHGEIGDSENESLVRAEASVIISGNTANEYGGGIASNSTVDFGDSEYELLTVEAHKEWYDISGNRMPDDETADFSVDIALVRTDEDGESVDLDKVTLNADNEWKCEFTDLPMTYHRVDNDGSINEYEYTYTTREIRYTADSAYATQVETEPIEESEDGSNEFIQEITVKNTKTEGLEIGKQVEGSTSQTDFIFKITLNESDGNPFEGDIDVQYYDKDPAGEAVNEQNDTLTFVSGECSITLGADRYINLIVSPGMKWSVEEVTDGADETNVSLNGIVTKAKAASGTIEDSTQVVFINKYREYYDIDEEIVPDENDRSTWEKSESVNEYNAIEVEMSTFLPAATPEDVANGDWTMLFHNKLDEGLLLDANEKEDLHITIGGKTVPAGYYTVDILTQDEWTIAPLALVDTEDCTFHVTVDLSGLYKDTDIVNDEDLRGETEIIIFFYVDLEGESMDGTYKSTVQYQIFDDTELLFTSTESVVEVYTYEIEISKYDTKTDASLKGAVFGVYYDEGCESPVGRSGNPYETESDDSGLAVFYGLAEGTYYIKELKAPDGYVLSDTVMTFNLGDLEEGEYIAKDSFGNTPSDPGSVSGTTVSLKVTNTVKGDHADTVFYYTATLSDTSINGMYGDMEFINGIATFSLGNGGEITAAGLPAGIGYEVMQTAVEGFSTAVNGESGLTVSGIIDTGTATAAFVNDSGSDDNGTGTTGSTGSRSSGGSSYSGSGSSHSSTGGPGAESTATESSGSDSSANDTSGSSVSADSIGELPPTGESNTVMILTGLCLALAVLLTALLCVRRKMQKDQV